MKTKKIEVIQVKDRNGEKVLILGTDYNQEFVAKRGYIFTMSWDYAKYYLQMNHEQLVDLSKALR